MLMLLNYLVPVMLAPAISFAQQDSQSPPPPSRELPDRGYGPSKTDQRSGPEIHRKSGRWVIDLPRAMEAALKRYNRRFEIWNERTFPRSLDSDVVAPYINSTRQIPWGVIGDFNGDGIADAAVSGNDDKEMLVLLVLSRDGGTYKVIRLESEPYSPDSRTRMLAPQLSYVYPGKYYTTASERGYASRRGSGRKKPANHGKTSNTNRKAVELKFPGISLGGGYRSSVGNTVFQVVDDEIVQLFDLEPISPARNSR